MAEWLTEQETPLSNARYTQRVRDPYGEINVSLGKQELCMVRESNAHQPLVQMQIDIETEQEF